MNDKDWIKNVYLPRLTGKILYVGVSSDNLYEYVKNPELFETLDIDNKITEGISPYKHHICDFLDFKEKYKYDHISMHGLWGDGYYFMNEGDKTNTHESKPEMTKKIINMIGKAHNMLNEGGTLQIGPNLHNTNSMDGILDYLDSIGYHTLFREYGAPKGDYGNYNYIFWGKKKTNQKFNYTNYNLWDFQDNHNYFGGWAIQESCFNFIREILPKGKTILELGSGYGTNILSKYYNMISIENQQEWVESFDSHYIQAPIKEYSDEYMAPILKSKGGQYLPGEDENGKKYYIQKGWYDHETLNKELKHLKYDLILVDGPNGKIGRGGFLKHLDLFNTNVPIIIDDVSREGERYMMEEISLILKKPYSFIDKNTGIIASENIIYGTNKKTI